MSRPNPVNTHGHRSAGGLEKLGSFLADVHPDLIISKRRMRKVESIECVRLKRDAARQNLGFPSRPFVLCGLPVRMPAPGCLLHERRNGQFVLQVTGHPSYGLPWGQDRLVPIFLATLAIRQQSPRITFDSAAETWTPLACSRAVRSIGVWLPPFNGSSARPSSSEQTPRVNVPRSSIAPGSIS